MRTPSIGKLDWKCVLCVSCIGCGAVIVGYLGAVSGISIMG